MRNSDWSSDVCSSDLADHAGALEQRTEQDEQEYEGGRHEGRCAVDSFGSEIEDVDDLFEIETAMDQKARQLAAEQRVGDENHADQRQIGRASCRERGCQ